MSQKAQILRYVQLHGSITTMESFRKLNCCRLSERIRELESLGVKFDHVKENRHVRYVYKPRKTDARMVA